MKGSLSFPVSVNSSQNYHTRRPGLNIPASPRKFHYLTIYPMVFKMLFLTTYPGCVQWESGHTSCSVFIEEEAVICVAFCVCVSADGWAFGFLLPTLLSF